MTANLRILAPSDSLDVTPIEGPNRPKFHRLSGDAAKPDPFVGKKYVEHGPMAESLAERTVYEGVDRFYELTAAERSPTMLDRAGFAPRGRPPEGFLVLRLFTRALDRDGRGNVRPQEYLSLRNSGPQRDFLWLTPEEWRALIPDDPTPGTTHPVPQAVAVRITRFYLNNGTRGVKFSWARAHCRSGGMRLTVVEATPDRLEMRLEGEARLSNQPDFASASRRARFELVGYLRYDRTAQRFRRWDVVALGEEYDTRRKVEKQWKHYGDSSGRTALGIAFELAEPESLGYGLPPWFIRYGSPEELRRYFGNEQPKETWAKLASYFALEAIAGASVLAVEDP